MKFYIEVPTQEERLTYGRILGNVMRHAAAQAAADKAVQIHQEMVKTCTYVTVKDLAEAMAVTEKTIRRYMKAKGWLVKQGIIYPAGYQWRTVGI